MSRQRPGAKCDRTRDYRTAVGSIMAAALLERGRIETAAARSKERRRWVERVITTAKTDDVAARRAVSVVVQKADVTEKLFSNLMPRLKDRPGGYTRVLKTAPRLGDGAAMVLIELVD